MANRDCPICRTYPCSCVDPQELQEEIDRLRAALVEKQALIICGEYGDVEDWDMFPEHHELWRTNARAELIAEGLLPSE